MFQTWNEACSIEASGEHFQIQTSPGTMIGDSDPRVHLSASCESLHCPQGDGDGDPDHRGQSQQVQSSQKGKEGWVGSIDKALAEQAGGLESGTQHPPKCWVGMGAICNPNAQEAETGS